MHEGEACLHCLHSGCSPLLPPMKDAEERAALTLPKAIVHPLVALWPPHMPTEVTSYCDRVPAFQVSSNAITLSRFSPFPCTPGSTNTLCLQFRDSILSLPLASNCFLKCLSGAASRRRWSPFHCLVLPWSHTLPTGEERDKCIFLGCDHTFPLPWHSLLSLQARARVLHLGGVTVSLPRPWLQNSSLCARPLPWNFMWTCLTRKGNSSILCPCSFPKELQEQGWRGVGGEPGPVERLSFAVALPTSSSHSGTFREQSPESKEHQMPLYFIFN